VRQTALFALRSANKRKEKNGGNRRAMLQLSRWDMASTYGAPHLVNQDESSGVWSVRWRRTRGGSLSGAVRNVA